MFMIYSRVIMKYETKWALYITLSVIKVLNTTQEKQFRLVGNTVGNKVRFESGLFTHDAFNRTNNKKESKHRKNAIWSMKNG